MVLHLQLENCLTVSAITWLHVQCCSLMQPSTNFTKIRSKRNKEVKLFKFLFTLYNGIVFNYSLLCKKYIPLVVMLYNTIFFLQIFRLLNSLTCSYITFNYFKTNNNPIPTDLSHLPYYCFNYYQNLRL